MTAVCASPEPAGLSSQGQSKRYVSRTSAPSQRVYRRRLLRAQQRLPPRPCLPQPTAVDRYPPLAHNSSQLLATVLATTPLRPRISHKYRQWHRDAPGIIIRVSGVRVPPPASVRLIAGISCKPAVLWFCRVRALVQRDCYGPLRTATRLTFLPNSCPTKEWLKFVRGAAAAPAARRRRVRRSTNRSEREGIRSDLPARAPPRGTRPSAAAPTSASQPSASSPPPQDAEPGRPSKGLGRTSQTLAGAGWLAQAPLARLQESRAFSTMDAGRRRHVSLYAPSRSQKPHHRQPE